MGEKYLTEKKFDESQAEFYQEIIKKELASKHDLNRFRKELIKGFKEVSKKFDGLEQRLAAYSSVLNQIKGGVNSLIIRRNSTQEEVDDHKIRIESLEQKTHTHV